MRRGQRHNAITNSPIVRSFIRPVLSTTPAPPATATSNAAQQETLNKYLGEVAQPDEQWLIPTQPSLVAAGGAAVVEEDAGQPGSSDVKGKKRARDEELDGEAQAVEYDAAAGTRFGVQVRYSEDNLPAELEKCASSSSCLSSLIRDDVLTRTTPARRLGATVPALLAVRRRVRDGPRGVVLRHARERRSADRRALCVLFPSLSRAGERARSSR